LPRLFRPEEIDRTRVIEGVEAVLSREPDIAFAYLFGSFLEGQPFHDVDVGAYFKTGRDSDSIERSLELAQRLTDHLNLPVDVRPLDQAPLSFRFHALRGQLLISHDDELLSDVIEETARRYLDVAPLLRQNTKEAFGP